MKLLFSIFYTIYIIASIYLAGFFLSGGIRKPPWTVRFAGYIEAGTGATLYLLGIWMLSVQTTLFVKVISIIILNVLGVVWFIMAAQFMKGSERARRVSLLFSILRFFTLVGTILSLVSIYLLYVPNKSKRFFALEKPERNKLPQDIQGCPVQK